MSCRSIFGRYIFLFVHRRRHFALKRTARILMPRRIWEGAYRAPVSDCQLAAKFGVVVAWSIGRSTRYRHEIGGAENTKTVNTFTVSPR